MLDILCVGDAIYDMFVKPHEAEVLESCKRARTQIACEPMLCFGYGAKINIEELDYSLGGSAANVAVGLKMLGKDSGLVSFIGSDYAGDKIREKLELDGVDIKYLLIDEKIKSSFSSILRHKLERTILIYRDKFDYARLKLPKTKKSRWIYISHLGKGYEEIYKKAIALASEKNVRIILNPGKIQLEEKKREFISLLKLTEILILNKEEAELLVGARFPLETKELFYKLADFGVKNYIITNGQKGAYARGENKEIIYEKALSVKYTEKTGAGDAFSAGFLASFIDDENLQKALIWGIINGARVTEKIGAQNGILTRSEMEEEYKKIC